MLEQKYLESLSDDEFFRLIEPHVNSCNEYLETYIIPEYMAFYLADAYSKNVLLEEPFRLTFNAATDIFNYKVNVDKAMEIVSKILKEKYSLQIISVDPMLKIEKI